MARRASKNINQVGYDLSKVGFTLLIVALSLWLSEVSPPVLSWEIILALGYAAGLVGAFVLIVGQTLRLAGLFAPRLVERLLLE